MASPLRILLAACTLASAAITLRLSVAADSGPATGESARNAPPDGYEALFNGKDLAGWRGMGTENPYKLAAKTEDERAAFFAKNQPGIEAHWKVVDGVLVNDGQGPYLTTIEDFGDVELWVDYKTVPKADSGIYLRATPQVQIWDSTETAKFKIGADKGSGGLWNNSPGAPGKDPLVLADKPFGEWNRFRIVQVGARTTVWLNDKLVVDNAIMENYWDRKKPLLRRGPIQLQTHGGEICWRNVMVRQIGPEEANRWLRERAGEGFEPVFNGQDLTGWAGATDNYEVVDGAIRCKPGKGGTLHTTEEYGDYFTANAIGALLNWGEYVEATSEHARQYHGSVYGMVAAQRGYLRPTGEWNEQEVTVKGSRITVELNGSVILDADVAGVKEFMGGKPHPGKDRTSGFFGFAGHGDAVEFRNVAIKRLN